jgi:uncharacterized protein YndB with AHSA1/START domain
MAGELVHAASFLQVTARPSAPARELHMNENLVAKASITIEAPAKDVWEALTDPEAIPHYMFGAEVMTDWTPGSPIAWMGEWEGKRFVDRGVVLEVEPEEKLVYSHYSPSSGLPDVPANHHRVTIWLTSDGDHTRVELEQDGCQSSAECERSTTNWETMLEGLKTYVEQKQAEHRFGSAAS